MSNRSRIMLEGAIAAALAMVLSFIPVKFGPGFSISLGMIPLTIYALRRGTVPALYSGLVWGLLHFLLGKVYILTLSQGLIEYIFAYLATGLAGVYSRRFQEALSLKSNKAKTYALLGTTVGLIARYVFHFIAGFIFWGKYAIWGLSPVVYSLVINGTSAVLTGIVTYIVIVLLLKKNSQLFIPKSY
ncbi:energy-coupled thiamine transporter ThiT [Vagococcus vulneris]|nr:energy-coupled thiamine transporter ThiT [Vagococcus vulneris]